MPSNVGIWLAGLSGVANGLFTAPMKLERRWRWEQTWFVFVIVACILLPSAVVLPALKNWEWLALAPRGALTAALCFGFLWGFGAICFGRSVDRLGVSVANSLVIGLSSALGSLLPIAIAGNLHFDQAHALLFAGIAMFLLGVGLCGRASHLRTPAGTEHSPGVRSFAGYLFALGAGVLSAIFNVGYSLALPIAQVGQRLAYSHFTSENLIWFLMLPAGAVPNLIYCGYLMTRDGSSVWWRPESSRSWIISASMGILWAGSVFLYGAATPLLGSLGPSVGWPLSLAIGLLVANLMGLLLGEWKGAPLRARRVMQLGIVTLCSAIVLCALAAKVKR